MRAAKQGPGRKGADQHVVPRPDGGWEVTRGKNGAATSVHRTQKAAVQHARESARRQRVALVVHGRDGRIRMRTDYGERPNVATLDVADEIITRHRETYAALARL
jgi:Uncharacterized protein conserved in bacteria (DUF2188)